MPTPAELDQLDDDLNNLQAVMIGSLVEQWMSTVVPNPADSLEDLQDIVTELIAQFAPASASIAVDFYNSVRPTAAPSFTPQVVVADDLLPTGTLYWSTSPVMSADWQDALDRTASSIQKSVKQALVDTIGEATELDPLEVKFARWPQNPDPCSWCVLRASRGAIYWSEASAERGDHLKCGCRATPVFSDEQLPYERKPYYAQYEAGIAESDGRDLKAILAGMRRANGTR